MPQAPKRSRSSRRRPPRSPYTHQYSSEPRRVPRRELLHQPRVARRPAVLVVVRPYGLDGRLLHEVGHCVVGKPLAQVDRVEFVRQLTELGEHRRLGAAHAHAAQRRLRLGPLRERRIGVEERRARRVRALGLGAACTARPAGKSSGTAHLWAGFLVIRARAVSYACEGWSPRRQRAKWHSHAHAMCAQASWQKNLVRSENPFFFTPPPPLRRINRLAPGGHLRPRMHTHAPQWPRPRGRRGEGRRARVLPGGQRGRSVLHMQQAGPWDFDTCL